MAMGAVLSPAATVIAAQVVDLSLNERVRQADAIVRGTIVSRQSRWGDASRRWMVTDYTLSDEEVLQPSAQGGPIASTIVVTYWGGTMDGETQAISDVRLPLVGDRLVLMLRPERSRTVGMTPVVGFNDGLFRVVTDATTGVAAVSEADGRPLALSPAGAVARRQADLADAPGVSLDAFTGWLRANLAAIKAAPAAVLPAADPNDPRLMKLLAKIPRVVGTPSAVSGRQPVEEPSPNPGLATPRNGGRS